MKKRSYGSENTQIAAILTPLVNMIQQSEKKKENEAVNKESNKENKESNKENKSNQENKQHKENMENTLKWEQESPRFKGEKDDLPRIEKLQQLIS